MAIPLRNNARMPSLPTQCDSQSSTAFILHSASASA